MASFETTIAAHTEALNQHTEALRDFIKVAGNGASASSKTTAKEADTKAAGTKAAGTKKKGVTLDTIKEKFGEYLNITDKAERKERLANVTKINEKFGVERISEVDAENYEEAIRLLNGFINGEDLTEEDGDDEGGSPI